MSVSADDSASEDDDIKLSSATLDALKDFYREKDEREKHFEALKSSAEDDFEEKKISMEAFAEDWNASQFWYKDATARTLAQALLDGVTSETKIAVVSAPSVFVQLKNLLPAIEASRRPSLTLLEFDERFGVFKEFVMYDFAHPMKLPSELKGAFDRIICDPPFLSTDCQTKGKPAWRGEIFTDVTLTKINSGFNSAMAIKVVAGEQYD